MESVRSRHGRSYAYYPEGGELDESVQEEFKRPLVAATETPPIGGRSAPRILVSRIADLKEFNG